MPHASLAAHAFSKLFYWGVTGCSSSVRLLPCPWPFERLYTCSSHAGAYSCCCLHRPYTKPLHASAADASTATGFALGARTGPCSQLQGFLTAGESTTATALPAEIDVLSAPRSFVQLNVMPRCLSLGQCACEYVHICVISYIGTSAHSSRGAKCNETHICYRNRRISRPKVTQVQGARTYDNNAFFSSPSTASRRLINVAFITPLKIV